MKSSYFSLILPTLLLTFGALSPSIALGSPIIIRYTFSGINPGNGLQTFQVDAPNFISPPPDQDFTEAELVYCTPTCSDVLFDRNSGNGVGDIITFSETGVGGWYYRFAPGAFSTVGNYSAETITGNPGTLTVSVVTPEPASAVLIVGGILFMAWRSRRRTTIGAILNPYIHNSGNDFPRTT